MYKFYFLFVSSPEKGENMDLVFFTCIQVYLDF